MCLKFLEINFCKKSKVSDNGKKTSQEGQEGQEFEPTTKDFHKASVITTKVSHKVWEKSKPQYWGADSNQTSTFYKSQLKE